MTRDDDWARRTTQRIADEAKRLRGKNTVEWLSDRTAELGHRISRSRISDLERGDRGGLLGVAELALLAKALRVPPILLLFPGMTATEVEVLPGHSASSWSAAQWFGGAAAYQATDEAGRFAYDREAFDDGARVLELARQEHQLIGQLAFVRRQRDAASRRKDASTDEVVKANEHVNNVEQQLRAVGRQITELGGQPFPVPEDAATAVTEDTDR